MYIGNMKNSKPLPTKRTVGSHASIRNLQGTTQNQQQNYVKQNPPKSQKENCNSINTQSSVSTNHDPICDICAQNVPGPEREKIFAFGKCDHHVCYVCSARLRAICDQLECPICREKLDSVIFSANKNKSFDSCDISYYIYDEKYKIYFESKTIKETFDKLLQFTCLKCIDSKQSGNAKKDSENYTGLSEFPDVLKLKTHLNFTHKLRLCDLCLNHNKLFPFEYSYYDYPTLRKHVKDGEPNTSHRGHPDCVLCHNTFFNQDDLLQHMSREHYHCHLCGRHNSTNHIYFQDYASLRLHFKDEHFLCERGNCRHEQFTSAFDSQIDYQLHIVHVHGGTANAGGREARQQRTITLESTPHRPPQNRNQSNVPLNAAVVSTGSLATANASDPRRQIPESIQAQIRQQRLPSRAEFPALGNIAPSSIPGPTSQSVSVPSTHNINPYPSLAQNNVPRSSNNIPLCYRVTAGPSSGRASFVRSAGGGCRIPEQINEMEFPPLPEQPKSKTSKTKSKQPKVPGPDEPVTLDQLISSNLVLDSKNKGKANKSGKTVRQKSIKIQL